MCDSALLRVIDSETLRLSIRIAELEAREVPDFAAELGGIRLLRDEMAAFLAEARALFAGAQQAVEQAEETAEETAEAVSKALAESEEEEAPPPSEEETPLMEQEIPLPEMLEPEEEEKDEGPDRTPLMERKLSFGRR